MTTSDATMTENEIAVIEGFIKTEEAVGEYDGEVYEELKIEPMFRDLLCLLAEVRRLRAENAELKTLLSGVLEENRRLLSQLAISKTYPIDGSDLKQQDAT